jgi:hypothetical protein
MMKRPKPTLILTKAEQKALRNGDKLDDATAIKLLERAFAQQGKTVSIEQADGHNLLSIGKED